MLENALRSNVTTTQDTTQVITVKSVNGITILINLTVHYAITMQQASSDSTRLDNVSQLIVMKINTLTMEDARHAVVSVINVLILKHVSTAEQLEITFSQLIKHVEQNVHQDSELIEISNASNVQTTVLNVQHYMTLPVQSSSSVNA